MISSYVLVLAYGQLPNGDLHPQTVARCRAAYGLYRSGLAEKVFVSNATRHESGHNMGPKMVECLISLGVQPCDIVSMPLGLNTTGEIISFVGNVPEAATLRVATSWYHVPRTALIFALAGRWVGLTWTKSCRLYDVLIEPVKLAKDIWRRGRDAKLAH